MRRPTVCAVIVTYGSRWRFLKEVIQGCINNGTSKIIVVDNASGKISRDNLIAIKKSLGEKLIVVRFEKNLGSAGGFRSGMIQALQERCEFIWLLDDDTVPMKGALNVLLKRYYELQKLYGDSLIALVSYRDSRPWYLRACIDSKALLGTPNSFLGLDFLDLMKLTIYRILRRLSKGYCNELRKGFKEKLKHGECIMPVSYWSGLFFRSELIKKVGLPREELYLYADDYEWTYRITLKGKLFLSIYSITRDLDIPPYFRKKTNFFKASKLAKSGRLYYSIRNGTWFRRTYLVRNTFIFFLNMALFLFLAKIFLDKQRFIVIKRAIKDGLMGNLGYRTGLKV